MREKPSPANRRRVVFTARGRACDSCGFRPEGVRAEYDAPSLREQFVLVHRQRLILGFCLSEPET